MNKKKHLKGLKDLDFIYNYLTAFVSCAAIELYYDLSLTYWQYGCKAMAHRSFLKALSLAIWFDEEFDYPIYELEEKFINLMKKEETFFVYENWNERYQARKKKRRMSIKKKVLYHGRQKAQKKVAREVPMHRREKLPTLYNFSIEEIETIFKGFSEKHSVRESLEKINRIYDIDEYNHVIDEISYLYFKNEKFDLALYFSLKLKTRTHSLWSLISSFLSDFDINKSNKDFRHLLENRKDFFLKGSRP